MAGILIALFYSVICTGTGLLLFRCFGEPKKSDQIQISLISASLIIGQALLSCIWLFLGLAGWLLPPVIWITLIALLVLSARLLWPKLGDLCSARREVRSWFTQETLSLRLVTLALLLLVSGFAIMAWVKPPIGDAEAFYMTYARIMAATGRIEPMPGLYEAFSSIGMVAEPQFAALIAISDVPTAKLFVWCLALAVGAVLYRIGQVAGLDRRGGLFLLTMLFTTTAFTHHIWDGKVDLFAAALGLLAVYYTLTARSRPCFRLPLALAGLCAGFAVVAKFSYAIALAPALLVLLPYARSKNWWFPMATVAFWASVATFPHLLKNTIMFSAPFAPFFSGASDQNWLQQTWFAPEIVSQIIISYPFALVFGRYPMQGGNLSLLLLAFAPLLWWYLRDTSVRRSNLMLLAFAAIAGTLTWVALRPSIVAPRYLLATLLLMYPLIANAAEQIFNCERSPRWISAAIIATILSAFAISSYFLVPAVSELKKRLTGNYDVCALASVYCEPIQHLNRAALAGDRVYALTYYTYWMRDDLLQCRDRGEESKRMRARGGPGLNWADLQGAGFRWLLIDRISHGKQYSLLLESPRPAHLEVNILYENEFLVVIQLGNPIKKSPPSCRQIGERAWLPVSSQ